MRRLWRLDLVLVAALVAAGALRFWGLLFGLPHTLARPDELAVIGLAVGHLNGDWAPDFFDYPRFLVYLLTALYGAYYLIGRAAGWFESTAHFALDFRMWHWEPLYVIARSASALFGTLTVLAVYHLTRRLFDRATARVAAVFVALTFLLVRNSHYATTDATTTFLLMWAMVAMVRAYQEPSRRSFLAAGALAGLATATKYTAVMIVAPLALSAGIRVLDARGRRLQTALRSGLPTMALAMAFVFLTLSSYIVWDHDRFTRGMRLLAESYQKGMSEGVDLGSVWWFHVGVSIRYGVGLPLLAAAFAGVLTLARREWRALVLLVSFPIAYFLVAGGGRLLFHRYMILVVPFLCVLAAFFTVAAGRWVAARLRLPSPAVVGALAVLTVAPTAWSAIRDDQLLARTDSRVLAAQWLRERARPGQALYQTGTHYGWIQLERGPRRYVNWNYNREFGLFRVGGDWAPGLPDWIVVQESPIPYSHGEIPPRLADLLRRRYDLCHRVRAVNPRDPRNIYDMQDAFYLPYAGFSNVTRPGPNIYIWKLRDDSGP